MCSQLSKALLSWYYIIFILLTIYIRLSLSSTCVIDATYARLVLLSGWSLGCQFANYVTSLKWDTQHVKVILYLLSLMLLNNWSLYFVGLFFSHFTSPVIHCFPVFYKCVGLWKFGFLVVFCFLPHDLKSTILNIGIYKILSFLGAYFP